MIIYAILGPPLLALLLAWIQHAYYQARVRSGALADEDRPFFGILVFRGLLVALGIVLLITFTMKQLVGGFENDPMLSPEDREALIERKQAVTDDGSDVEGEQDASLEAAMGGDEVDEVDEGAQPPSATDPADP